MVLLKHRKITLNVFLYLFLLSGSLVTAQKAQRIAYIDMEYILENVPEYLEAQNTLDSKVTKWRSTLDKLSRFIEKSKTDLANEREILTEDHQVIIPDRLVFTSCDTVVIIDYKTGLPSKEHHQQLLKYERALNTIGYRVDKKLLVYINKEIDVVAV